MFERKYFTEEFVNAIEEHFMCTFEELTDEVKLEQFTFYGEVYNEIYGKIDFCVKHAYKVDVPKLRLDVRTSHMCNVDRLLVSYSSRGDQANLIRSNGARIEGPKCSKIRGRNLNIDLDGWSDLEYIHDWQKEFGNKYDRNEFCMVSVKLPFVDEYEKEYEWVDPKDEDKTTQNYVHLLVKDLKKIYDSVSVSGFVHRDVYSDEEVFCYRILADTNMILISS